MPIQLVCPTCAKRLQVGDQYAGRKVACPGCRTVVTAPGGPSGPAAPAARPPAPAAARIPAPPSAPAPTPEPADSPFGFGAAGRGEPEPAPRKGGIVGSVGGGKEPPRPARRSRDDDDETPPTRRPARGRAAGPEPKDSPAKAWRSFGGGCAVAKWGMWIEFLALAAGLGVFGYVVVGVLDAASTGSTAVFNLVDDLGGPFVLAPFFLGTFLGSLLVLVGRTRMMNVPKTAGVKKVLFGAWAFTLLRFLAVLAAVGLLLGAGSQWEQIKAAFKSGAKLPDGFAYFLGAFAAFAAGVPFLVLADLSTIPAAAVVGGELPSARLRRRAALVTFVLQLLVLAYVVVGIGAGVAGAQVAQRFGRGAADPPAVAPPAGAPAPAPVKAADAQAAKPAVVLSLGVLLLAQLAYTALFASLFSAGQAAVREAREAQERAEDEDV